MTSKYELLPTSDHGSPRSLSPAFSSSSSTLNSQADPRDLYDDHDDHDVEYDAPLTSRNRDTRECIRAFHADPRFNPPPPSPYARIVLLCFIIFLFWLAFSMRKAIWADFGMGMGSSNGRKEGDSSY